MAEKRGAGALLGGLIAGAIAGTVAALLLAPKAGRETRDLIKEKGGEYIGTLRERIRRDDSS
ncbi:MAG TPA: YtxH domain-containing protein [Dehalococcoidia bacterium]|jgi:gas vesicle protein|nr:YtxH domain-containing protein [Dehalococcoidia bacterium]